ncbi:REPTOR-binding partner isoform X2 [Drosophila willistoni]|uniref:REPTOR-binding partner isoform X2 n=1 Tax=Drosophila willistoni TaxID=7260 RepID=UPI001F07129D|nr:REPTOR-binding partner isoform X2 [Drosophila willistoni]
MDCESIQMAIAEEVQPTTRKECGKRGRKPGRKTSNERIDMKAKLERSRQSARECRARKKLRYQYLEELVADREKAIISLRDELERYMLCSKQLCDKISSNNIDYLLKDIGIVKQEQTF